MAFSEVLMSKIGKEVLDLEEKGKIIFDEERNMYVRNENQDNL